MYTTDTKELIGQSPLDEHEAHYQYYKHGPLARVVLGQQQVQGVDYAYTLQGWLKGVNSTAGTAYRDMGGDGYANGHRLVGRDAYGFNLNYYTGDYLAIGSGVEPFPGHTAYLGSAYKPLYNGNISSMAVTINTLNQPQLYNYQYDQLNRIVGMDVYRGLNTGSNSWSAISLTTDYKERVSYDANGNILQYLRNGTTSGSRPLDMDSLSYAYNRDGNGNLTNNRLRHVKDAVGASSYLKEDIDNQVNDNYAYDAIGNLTKDSLSGVYNIQWNVYGKVKAFNRYHYAATDTNTGSTTVYMEYRYDANGNRIGSINTRYPGPHRAVWYVRDAQGNVMAVYEKVANSISSGQVKLIEHHIYGSSRLGIHKRDQDADVAKETAVNVNLLGPTYLTTFERGNKFFELSNHLGNVLVTVSDKHTGVDTSSDGEYDYYEPDVVSASDYYPFGMQMVGRVSESAKYRYGFNGQEKSDEIMGNGNSYTAEFWQYDARIGRRWNMDPIIKEYESPYAVLANNPIWNIDLYGADTAKYLSNAQLKDAVTLARKQAQKVAQTKGANYHDKKYQKELEEQVKSYAKKNDLNWKEGIEFQNQTLLYFSLYYYQWSWSDKSRALLAADDQSLNNPKLSDQNKITVQVYEIKMYEKKNRALRGAAIDHAIILAAYLGAPRAKVGKKPSGTRINSKTQQEIVNAASATKLQLQSSVETAIGGTYRASGEVTVQIKNTELLNSLNATSEGNWVKVYEAGMRGTEKIEVHYFRNNTTMEVFDVKIKYNYWHQNQFKNLNE